MNAKLIIAAVIGALILAHPRLSVAAAGMSLSVPVPVLLAGAVALACAVLSLLAVRALSRIRSCPYPHAVT